MKTTAAAHTIVDRVSATIILTVAIGMLGIVACFLYGEIAGLPPLVG